MLKMERAEAFELWLKQLRDPESKKAQGELEYLNEPEARCCLGHACHVFISDTRQILFDEVCYGTSLGSISSSDLPFEVMDVLKIGPNGEFKEPMKVINTEGELIRITTLACLNDKTDYSLAEIADVIEDKFHSDGFDQVWFKDE